MVYSSKDFESLWFLYQAEGLPKNISIEEFFASKAAKPSAAQSTEFLLPKGRKNSLTFGSHDGVEVSVIYHTFIETCKMCRVSTLEYFKEFFNSAIKREQF